MRTGATRKLTALLLAFALVWSMGGVISFAAPEAEPEPAPGVSEPVAEDPGASDGAEQAPEDVPEPDSIPETPSQEGEPVVPPAAPNDGVGESSPQGGQLEDVTLTEEENVGGVTADPNQITASSPQEFISAVASAPEQPLVVTLESDLDLGALSSSVSIPANAQITIDLAGHTLSLAGEAATSIPSSLFEVNGKLTIRDQTEAPGAIAGSNAESIFAVRSGGNLTLAEGGAILRIGENCERAVFCESKASFKMGGGL